MTGVTGNRRIYTAALAFMICYFVLTGLFRASLKSPVADESAHHIPSGYVYWKYGDFVFATDSPPLARMLGTLPMLAMDIDMPGQRQFRAREDRAEFARELLYELNRSRVSDIFFYGRLVILLLGVFGGLYIFRWTARNFGRRAAVLAAGFYFLSPNIIAHATIVTTDMAATVFIMCAALSFRDLISAPAPGKAFLAGAFFALALLSKFSALLLLPVFLVVLSWRLIRGGGKTGRGNRDAVSIPIFFASVCFILWAGYGVELEPMLHNALRAGDKKDMFEKMLTGLSFSGDQIRALTPGLYTVPVPLRSFVLGVLGVLRHGSEGARTFFMGSWSHNGHPLYYLTAFFVKTPPATILSFFAGIAVVARERRYRRSGIYLLAVMILFFLAASKADLQLGLRYVLPVYPMIFITAGVGLGHVMDTSRAGRVAAMVIAGWLVYSSIMIWPHHLSYFSQIAGGPEQGYRYFRGSNIDWGQDLPALKSYMEKADLDGVRLSYWGEADPSLYGIAFTVPEEGEFTHPLKKVYAVSVNNLDTFKWTARKRPDARAGYSIHIYDLREMGYNRTSP